MARLERLRRTLEDYRETLQRLAVEQCVVGATSATREARNRQAVADLVRAVLGVELAILSGEEEARWSLAGALAAPGMPEGPCLAVDIGGGSTELVAGQPRPDGTLDLTMVRSLPLGTVRLTERYVVELPPAPEVIARVQHHIRNVLAEVARLSASNRPVLIGVAGTCVSLAALETRRFPLTSPVVLERTTVAAWCDRLLQMPAAAIRALWPELLHGRADVLPVGALLLHEIMTWGDWTSCYVSPFGLRHGLLLRHLNRS